MKADAKAYWESVAKRWSETSPQRLWRTHSNRLNSRWIASLLGDRQFDRALKTDLFDEATSVSGLIPLLHQYARGVVGIDLSYRTGRAAGHRHSDLTVCTADARVLPFADASFDLVVSNSTLDHGESCEDIAAGLQEFSRVLRPSGRLLVTLDNLHNPVVALRNALPHRLLAALRLVPYYVGATCGPRRLRSMSERAGLRPLVVGAMMHCPRLPAVAVAGLLDRLGSSRVQDRYLKFLRNWEKLENLPTRFFSGYFITLLAERPNR